MWPQTDQSHSDRSYGQPIGGSHSSAWLPLDSVGRLERPIPRCCGGEGRRRQRCLNSDFFPGVNTQNKPWMSDQNTCFAFNESKPWFYLKTDSRWWRKNTKRLSFRHINDIEKFISNNDVIERPVSTTNVNANCVYTAGTIGSLLAIGNIPTQTSSGWKDGSIGW